MQAKYSQKIINNSVVYKLRYDDRPTSEWESGNLQFLLLLEKAVTSMGIVFAAKMQTMESFQMIMNFLIMPLFILSGAMFPLARLPDWLRFLTRIDPLSYGVDALRGLMLGPKLAEFSLGVNVALLAVFATVMISLAVYFFEQEA